MKATFQFTKSVPSEWVDYNGHMNDAEYNRAFSLATDAFIEYLGLDEEKRNDWKYTFYTLETHTCYLNEMKKGQSFNIKAQVLDYDAKRIHLFLFMQDEEGNLVATLEEMLMGIDQTEGRGAPFPASVAESIAEFFQAQEGKDYPKQAGRTIGIRRK